MEIVFSEEEERIFAESEPRSDNRPEFKRIDGIDYSGYFPRCSHHRTEVRLRIVAGGTKRWDEQCLVCGASRGSVKASRVTNPSALSAWDETLRERFTDHCRQYHDWNKRRRDDEWHSWYYGTYLRSREWAAKSEQVLKRCRRVCEGCGSAPATIAHHLSYEHVSPDLPFGSEFLWELRGVCKACHDRCHPNKKEQAA